MSGNALSRLVQRTRAEQASVTPRLPSRFEGGGEMAAGLRHDDPASGPDARRTVHGEPSVVGSRSGARGVSTSADLPGEAGIPTASTRAWAAAAGSDRRISVSAGVGEPGHDGPSATRVDVPVPASETTPSWRPAAAGRPGGTSSAIRASSREGEGDSDAGPVVHITIGRVEVRASVTAPTVAAASARARQAPGPVPLEVYLAKRRGGEAR